KSFCEELPRVGRGQRFQPRVIQRRASRFTNAQEWIYLREDARVRPLDLDPWRITDDEIKTLPSGRPRENLGKHELPVLEILLATDADGSAEPRNRVGEHGRVGNASLGGSEQRVDLEAHAGTH